MTITRRRTSFSIRSKGLLRIQMKKRGKLIFIEKKLGSLAGLPRFGKLKRIIILIL